MSVWDYTIDHHENEEENESKITDPTWIDLGLDMDTNIIIIKSLSVWWWCLYVLSNA